VTWELDEKGRCPHEHTFKTRRFLGRCRGWEVFQCPDCGYIYLGVGVPLAYFLELEDRLLKMKNEVSRVISDFEKLRDKLLSFKFKWDGEQLNNMLLRLKSLLNI